MVHAGGCVLPLASTSSSAHDKWMASPDPRAALLAAAVDPFGDIGAAALWLAAEDNEGVDVAAMTARLDELAAEVRTRAGGDPRDLPDVVAIRLLAGLLSDRLGLRGGDGEDPRTHYLHSVIERGEGVPIACAALWLAVGRRARVRVQGVGLPGHFVVRVGEVLADPFGGGTLLDEEGARRLAATGLGGQVPDQLPEAWTRALTLREMLARMSRNLRACHAMGHRWGLALQAADRCVALQPLEAADRRERGLLRFRVGLAMPALRDLRTYLAAMPDASDRQRVETIAARALGMVN